MVRIVDLLQIISAGAGILGFGTAAVVAFFAVKSGKLQSANSAQSSALEAMKTEVESLHRRVEDTEKENVRLEQTIQTICEALKMRGLVITIQGEMVNIQDNNGRQSTTKIRNIKGTP